jgi:hypothetical protein
MRERKGGGGIGTDEGGGKGEVPASPFLSYTLKVPQCSLGISNFSRICGIKSDTRVLSLHAKDLYALSPM